MVATMKGGKTSPNRTMFGCSLNQVYVVMINEKKERGLIA
jgi:hypothetical protein